MTPPESFLNRSVDNRSTGSTLSHMDQTSSVSVREFRDRLAVCLAEASEGGIIYIRNDKERGRPFKAAVVSVEAARKIETLKNDANPTTHN